jgi:hypothetical protein
MSTPNFHVGVFYTQDHINLAKKKRRLHQFLSQWIKTVDYEDLTKQLQIVKESMEETYNTHPLGQHRAYLMLMNKYSSTTYDSFLTMVAFLKSSGYNENLIYDYIFNLFLQYNLSNQKESETTNVRSSIDPAINTEPNPC